MRIILYIYIDVIQYMSNERMSVWTSVHEHVKHNSLFTTLHACTCYKVK